MTGALRRYARWLHLRWPAGTVEPLPVLGEDGATPVPGLRVAGDLRGIPLLKFALDGGARAVAAFAAERSLREERARGDPETVDLAIVGAGPAGMAAALAARGAGVSFRVLEAARPFSTVADFPAGKPIFTYPTDLVPEGPLRVGARVKEDLLAELLDQTRDVPVEAARVTSVRRGSDAFTVDLEGAPPVRARRVLLAVGRTGNWRPLPVAGADLPKVHRRLHDPKDHAGRRVLVVGGGDAAVEAAVALSEGGAEVTLAHRAATLARPKPENLARLASSGVRALPSCEVREIRENAVVLEEAGGLRTLDNDLVFALIGRTPPLDLLRRCGLRIHGDWTRGRVLAGFLLFCVALYDWKSGGLLSRLLPVPLGPPADPKSLAGVVRISASGPSFWYTVAYSAIVVGFGLARMKRRRTPYVRAQTWTLMAIQVLPLFVLPEILLPWMGAHGGLPEGLLDALFPRVDYGHGREYWRAYGLILAWPLNVYNVFTERPLPWWLAISFVQTFVLIPAVVLAWGKGAYCGWICSCGALAETLGDAHRDKMPHGPRWNRLNMAGQVLLAVAFLLLAARIAGWAIPGYDPFDRASALLLSGSLASWKWTVDVFLGGVIGYGLYFWFSGRVWCRFFCPLAALMHVYARFTRFRILAVKSRCISCNVCTSVCHQGIDVMAFANKGLPMEDPQCVRCSACVSSCPTAVLSFGRVDPATGAVTAVDRLPASLVQIREATPPAGGRS